MVDFREDFNQYAISKLPSFRDDFTVHGTQTEADASWVPVDATKNRVNIGTDVLDLNIIRDNTNDAIAHDLGSTISDSNWVLRFKLTIDTLNQQALQTNGWFGLFDQDEIAGEETQQSGIGVVLTCLTGTLTYRLFSAENQFIGGGVSTTFAHALAVETVYVEIKRNSKTSYEVNLYSDAKYSTLIESQKGITTSGVIDLRYIAMKNNMSMTVSSSILGSMDDVEFWDSGKQIIFQDDFATSSNWVQTGTGVTITGGVISGWGADGTDRRLTHDLGSPISDTNWKAEFEYMFTASNIPAHVPFVISDINQDIDAGTNDNDFLGVSHGSGVNELRIVFGDFQDLGVGSGSTGIPISTSTQYFVRLERLSSTQMRLSVYSDSGFTTHIASSPVTVTIPSTVDVLQYVHSQNASGGGASRSLTGTLDNLVISENKFPQGTTEGTVTIEEKFKLRTGDFEDDFTTYSTQPQADASWVPLDATQIVANIGTDEIDWNERQDGAGQDDTISHDLIGLDGVTPDPNNWVLRFKVDITTLLASSSDNHFLFFGLSDSSVGTDTNQDSIGVMLTGGSGILDWKLKGADAINLGGAGPTVATFATGLATGIIYWEVKRTSSTTVEASMFSDAGYTVLVERQAGTITAIAGLQYIKIANQQLNSASVDTQPQVVGTLDDVKFYNGASVLTDWMTTDGKLRVDTTNRNISGTFVADNTNDAIALDIFGANVSDTNWTLRYKISFQTVDDGGNTQNKGIYIGLFDQDQNSSTFTNQNSIYHQWLLSSNRAELNLARTINDQPEDSNNTDKTIDNIITVSTQFIELKRTGSDSYEMSTYSDAEYRNLVNREVGSLSVSGVSNLRYLKIMNQFFQNGAGELVATIDDVEFYDGVSVAKTPVKLSIPEFEDKFPYVDQTVADIAWVSTDVARLDPFPSELTWDIPVAGTTLEEVIYHDLVTPLKDDRWTCRFKFDIQGITSDNAVAIVALVGLSSNNGLRTVAQDGVAIQYSIDTGAFQQEIRATHAQNQGFGVNQNGIRSSVSVETQYVEIKRTSSESITINIYSDPDYTTLTDTLTQPIPNTITGLQFIKVMLAKPSGTNAFNGIVDDIQVWNGKDATLFENNWKVVNE